MVEAILYTAGAEPAMRVIDPTTDPGGWEPGIGNDALRVYIVQDTDVDRFAGLAGKSRAPRQNVAKELSRYLPVESGIVVLRAKYASASRLIMALRAFFGSERVRQDGSGVLILGVRSGDTKEEKSWKHDLSRDIHLRDVFEGLREALDLPSLSTEEDPVDRILGGSPPMVELRKEVRRAAKRSTRPVLLLGETGTGKTFVAKIIHAASKRSDKRLVRINSPSLIETLYRAEMHGARGNLPGMPGMSIIGKFELANGGSLTFEELGAMTLTSQAQLLEDLEEKLVQRLGDDDPTPVDFRLMATTDRDLHEAVERGGFRQPLYERFAKGYVITMPTLRDIRDDVPTLAKAFWERFLGEHAADTDRTRSGGLPEITEPVLKRLREYSWPGNIRQLEGIVETLVLDALDGEERDLGKLLRQGLQSEAVGEVSALTRIDIALAQVHELADSVFAAVDTPESVRKGVTAALRGHIERLDYLCRSQPVLENDETLTLVERASSLAQRFSDLLSGHELAPKAWSTDVEAELRATRKHLESRLEEATEAVHRKYIESRRRVIGTSDLTPHEELSDEFRESSRQQFLHMSTFFKTCGYWMRRARLGEIVRPELTEEELDTLAGLEHDRWHDERIDAGWERGPERDAVNKTNPLLARWGDLDEDLLPDDRKKARQMARDAVRAFPEILAGMGVELYRA